MLMTMITGLLTLSASVAPECTVQRPMSERRCVHGFITCEHGYCDRITDPCTCDSDIWSGVKCEKLYCPPECNGLCECNDNNVVCLQAETSQISDSTVPITQVVTTQTHNPRNDVIQQEHVCSDNYTLRPLLERYCIGVFCKYGECVVTERGNHRCQCDLGGDGDLCEKRCCKSCGNFGCMIINGTEYCDDENPPGKDTILDPVEEIWYWYLIVALVVVTASIIFMLYILWWKRYIPVLKLVHYFKSYEDDEEREWDAFISYKSEGNDEQFVLKYLHPKLELELGFKLCLHFRDFIPGNAIANNILQSVTKSRRVILLLTPRFIESEWTKFEYQKAQYEMIHGRQTIIPIILEDISSFKKTMDINLQHILKSVTYLEWPGVDNPSKEKKFWTRLMLALPKRKEVEERIQTSDDPASRYSVQHDLPGSIIYTKEEKNLKPNNTIIQPVVKLEKEEKILSDIIARKTCETKNCEILLDSYKSIPL
ncbi:uncharacterized protein LOC134697033 isoform X1 [Mytilus trossulus]|uniref:uncharacterized protein LOC134697033 isoform X1 n=1 Tax=Mytilus trossulus TaxID=6551 RepID=UPI003007BBAB